MQITTVSDVAYAGSAITRLYLSLTQSLPARTAVWVNTVRVRQVMNSLFEVVLWGAPAVLLSWGLLLGLACVVVFREGRSPRDESRRSGLAGPGA